MIMDSANSANRDSNIHIPLSVSNDKGHIRGLVLGFIGLLFVEVFCFIVIVKQVGFYLDDWIMINTLAQGPDSFWELFGYYFQSDPRVVNRPIEALHYQIMFMLFGSNPLGYHLLNGVMEIVSAGILFLCLVAITKRKAISFLAAAIFLLYPNHNITHYWVVSSSVTLSMVLYLGSLYCDLQAVLKEKRSLHLLSGFLFALGLFNYEVFLPLATLNVLVVFWLSKNYLFKGTREAFLKALTVALTLGLSLVALLLYLKVIVPLIGPAWLHQVKLEPGLMFSTIFDGCLLNIAAYGYFFHQAGIKLASGLSAQDWICLASLAFTTAVVFLLLNDGERSQSDCIPDERKLSAFFIGAGVLTVIFSYTIFGLNPEYTPTLITMVNRVNAGSTVGIAFIFTGLCVLFSGAISPKVSLIPGLCLILLFALTNLSLAHPFVISWQVQKQVMNAVKANRERFADAESILLANCPRYVNEAAVFDGVWDFQSMIRFVLDRKDINGGVICERLHLTREDIKDRSTMGGFLCATHHYDKLFVIISPLCEVVQVRSPEELITLVETRGMQFELNKDLPNIWRKHLDSSGDCNVYTHRSREQ